jgi:serine/threonine protein kinase
VITDLYPGDPTVVGPYKLLKRLGQGGMGVVFLARSPGGRQVAVKVIRPEYANDAGFRARFAREVGAARNVSGMFTALVVDADTQGQVPWLATAYVPGHSLAEAVETQGPLPPASVLQLAAGLAEGLQAIHEVGVVHRDLKPSNVLLAADGPRVIDFGISKAREASMLTQTGMVMGSPGFLSPEQAEGHEVGTPSDVFSLGGVLTYAATGAGPFGSGPTVALMYRVVARDPDLSKVPDAIRPVIARCLAKNPAERPTPAQMLVELDDLGAGVGVVTPEWLPESITTSIARYVATAMTPAESMLRSRASSAAGGAFSAAGSIRV